jgi:hypothetical protein
MKNSRFVFLSAGTAAFSMLVAFSSSLKTEPVELVFPKSWPKPNYDFSKNPLTKEGIELVRRFFLRPDFVAR